MKSTNKLKIIKQDNIPWQKSQDWKQVFESIKRIDNLYSHKMKTIRKMAKQIRCHYDQISESIEKVCLQTCPNCTDICCIRATIWFDFKDLLYVYFGLDTFPAAQIIKKRSATFSACNCLSKKGCKLLRMERPFVCTWYFCPAQTTYLCDNDIRVKMAIDDHLKEIKALRQKMEDTFILVASGRDTIF